MGTHRRSGLRHVLLGSVAETVMRTAPWPVFTVKAAANPTQMRMLNLSRTVRRKEAR